LYPIFIGVPSFVTIDSYIDGGMGTGGNPGPHIGNPWLPPFALS